MLEHNILKLFFFFLRRIFIRFEKEVAKGLANFFRRIKQGHLFKFQLHEVLFLKLGAFLALRSLSWLGILGRRRRFNIFSCGLVIFIFLAIAFKLWKFISKFILVRMIPPLFVSTFALVSNHLTKPSFHYSFVSIHSKVWVRKNLLIFITNI